MKARKECWAIGATNVTEIYSLTLTVPRKYSILMLWIVSVFPPGLLNVHLCFLLKCVFMILNFVDVTHSTSMSPLSFRWTRGNYPVTLPAIFVHPPKLKKWQCYVRNSVTMSDST